jgi:hypothetical protein
MSIQDLAEINKTRVQIVVGKGQFNIHAHAGNMAAIKASVPLTGYAVTPSITHYSCHPSELVETVNGISQALFDAGYEVVFEDTRG